MFVRNTMTLMASLLVAATVMADHNFQGEFRGESSGAGQSREISAIIGSDYIEMQGRRENFDSISERGGYLVFEVDGQEDVFEIIDDNTLRQQAGVATTELRRVLPHGFEGDYADVSGYNDGLVVTIGAQSIEFDGQPETVHQIDIQEHDDVPYLVAEMDGYEYFFEIIDDETLHLWGSDELQLELIQD